VSEGVRRRRIVQLSGSAGGGVRRHVREVARALAVANDVVLAGPASVVEGTEPPVHTVVVDITDRPRPGDELVVRQIRVVAAGADVVHAHGLRAGALAALAIGSLGAREQRPALVVTLHNLPVGGARVQAVSAILERLVARRADAVLGVSGDLVERARSKGAALAERALVPAPPSREPQPLTPEQRAELGWAPGKAVVLTVARLAPQKGLELLLETAERLASDGVRPEVVWAVAGDGPLLPGLRQRIEEDELPVRLLGRRDDVVDLLAAADVVVSTSEWEGQPLGIQEALAVGAPVVATNVGGTAEVTADAAVLVPYPDSAGLAAAVRDLLGDPGRRAELSVAARARADALPRLTDVLAQLEGVYDRVLG
jgi:glycosyltransferase involved in cell wall biosynthesis